MPRPGRRWRQNTPVEVNQFLHARQNSNLLTSDFFYRVNSFHAILNYGCGLFILLLASTSLWKKISPLSRRLIVYVLLALLMNAFVAAAFNAPNDRYQSRVMWLLPFSVMLVLLSDFRDILSYLRGKKDQATRPGLSPRNDFQPL